MPHYLLSVITPTDGQMPSPEAMAEIVRKLEIFHDELQAAGAWVFAGGCTGRRPRPCCAPRTATC